MLPSCRAQMQQQSCGSSRVLPLTLLYWRMRGSQPQGRKAAARRMWGQPAARLQGCRQAHVGAAGREAARLPPGACGIQPSGDVLVCLLHQQPRRVLGIPAAWKEG